MKFTKEYFDEGIYRVGTRCEKWDMMREESGEDALPLWVADMDFPSPPAVQQAMLTRAAHGTYGYTEPLDDDYQALTDFWQRRHGLTLEKEDVMLLPCVVTGLKTAILALTAPGDGVILQSPVYGPFRMSVEATGRRVMDCPLVRREDGRYDMDLHAVEEAVRQGAKCMLLCSPHNPVSRLWSREELTALYDVLHAHDVPLVCDEIHADFVYAPGVFVPMLSIAAAGVISLVAASKTFNLAGLQQASLLCREADTRTKVGKVLDSAGVRSGNIFALEGTRAAYNEGDAWLDGLLRYLDTSRKLLADLVAEHLPKAVLTPMEATYLGWLDLRAYGYTTSELMERTKRAGVVFTEGTFFDKALGEGFLRVNIGCPARYLEEGILRLKVAIEKGDED